MKKIFLIKVYLLIFLFFILGIKPTFSYELSGSEFYIGEEVTITGDGFGAIPGNGGICFQEDNLCYLEGNSGIIYWSDTQIIFRVPGSVPLDGEISIYDSNSQFLDDLSYTILPYISQISDGEFLTEGLIPGDILYIDGNGFGEVLGSVMFGNGTSSRRGEIIKWEENEIWVEVPSFSVGDEGHVTVVNSGNGRTSVPFKVLKPITDDPFSYLQEYLNINTIEEARELLFAQDDIENEEIIIAVIDDGVYQNHPELEDRLWKNEDEIPGNNKDDDENGYIDDFLGYNFVDNNEGVDQTGGHGTGISGFIGAIRNNNIGIAGIADNIKIMPLVACGKEGTKKSGCKDIDIIDAIYYAVDNGARVINLSLGGQDTDSYVDDFNDSIKYAYDNNVVIIVAAGNGDPQGGIGYNLSRIPDSPVCNDNGENMVLGIGATDQKGKEITEWSNYGECVDLYIPGENLPGLNIPDDGYSRVDGTSFSAAIASGISALLLSAYPEMSNTDLYNYLISSKNDLGVLDTEEALRKIIRNHSENPNYSGDNDTEDKREKSDNENENKENIDIDIEEAFVEDIKNSAYSDAILYLKSNNMVSGYPDGTYRPTNNINRAEFTKIIIGAINEEPTGNSCFPDIAGQWFAPYVCAAKWNNILSGYPDGTFRPANNINVAEALKITLEAFGKDIQEPSADEEWYMPYLAYAKINGLYLDTFISINKNITREEMAELIYRVIEMN